MTTSRWLLPVSLAVLGAAVPLSACSSNKNHAERDTAPEAQVAIDPAHNDITIVEERQAARKATCVGKCLPDNDGAAVSCAAAEADSEFYWAWRLAERALNAPPATYFYDDHTTDFLVPERDAWQPPGDPVTRCQEDPNTFAVRLKGGPFASYGGGFGMSFCTAANPCTELPASAEFPLDAMDLSAYEGIAIWARRGPEGMANLRVGVSEKHSAEDLNTGSAEYPEREGRYCSRYRLCGCAPDTPCTPRASDGQEFCFDPAVSPEPDGVTVKGQTCGKTRCNEANSSTTLLDPLFGGRECANAVQSDGLTAEFCYNPGQDPNPPAKRERCGNPFVFPIRISTQWSLIKVPFSELRQSDEANVANGFDLKSIRQLIFTHSTGYADFYISDVGFYRRRPKLPVTPL
jgi:hypothetical protein